MKPTGYADCSNAGGGKSILASKEKSLLMKRWKF